MVNRHFSAPVQYLPVLYSLFAQPCLRDFRKSKKSSLKPCHHETFVKFGGGTVSANDFVNVRGGDGLL